MKQLVIPEVPCPSCGQLLGGIEFSQHYMLVCKNWRCLKHRQPQGYIEKETGLLRMVDIPVVSSGSKKRKA